MLFNRYHILHLCRDEQGKMSAARVAFWLVLLNVLALIWLDALHGVADVPATAYALLSGLMIALIAWAGGPRIAQYVAPQIGAIASGVGQALKGRPPLARAIDDPDGDVAATQ